MELKRVSFEIAKAIKDAGYSVDVTEENEDNVFVVFSDEPDNPLPYSSAEIQGYFEEWYLEKHNVEWCFSPTYLEVWLWLWREKNIQFSVNGICDYHKQFMYVGCDCGTLQLGGITTSEFNDPEEAIIGAIKYLCENNLIK